MRKIFIIRGANFYNKGAQSMLFITVSELRKRFRDCEIIVCSYEKADENYNFKIAAVGGLDWKYLQGDINLFHFFAKKLVKTIIGRRDNIQELKKFKKYFLQSTALIDISGYALSSQRELIRTKSYLAVIACCKKHSIPVFVMPQSIGPFDYEDDNIKQELKTLLKYPVIIYPREKMGYERLKTLGLDNVTLSYDLVLQNKSINLNAVYNGSLLQNVPKLQHGNNVAIIPNARNFVYGSKIENIINIYKIIIKQLKAEGKKTYILRHSSDDLEACHKLYDSLDDKENIHLLLADYNSVEFNSIIQYFDFVVGSRYHSIVHSYKNGVPAIVLGWAEKYHALLSMFEQEQYMFDVRGEIDTEKFLIALQNMCQSYNEESKHILELLPEYQNENCFDILTQFFNVDKEI